MKFTLTLTLAVLLTAIFFLGCEQATAPVGSEDSDGYYSEDRKTLDRISAELEAQQEVTLEKLALDNSPSGPVKGDGNNVDFANNYWRGYVYPYDGWSQTYVGLFGITLVSTTVEWRRGMDGDSEIDYVILPMTEEIFDGLVSRRGVYVYNGNYTWTYDFEYCEYDPATGLSGFKIESPNVNFEINTLMQQNQIYWYGELEVHETEYAVVRADGDISWMPTWLPYYEPPTPSNFSLSGVAFYDVNENGVQDAGEFGFDGVDVSLSNGATTTTDGSGAFLFEELEDGDYTVEIDAIGGFNSTTGLLADVTIDGDDEAVGFGYNLNFDDLTGATADSRGLGFWKTNVKKAVEGKNRGVQVDAATLESYRASLENFGYAALNHASLSDAFDAMASNNNQPVVRLGKHLTASEYNYAHGAYLNDNELVTRAFILWGEHVIENGGEYNDAKDLFEGYNEGEIE